MSSMPPPRGGLVKGDHVLISGVWFEMMNSAPQRRPSAVERSISDFSRASVSSELESRSRDRSAHSHILVERDEFQVLKPRPTQTRSHTARSTSYLSNQVHEGQGAIGSGGSLSVEDCTRDRNGDDFALGDKGRIKIPKPGCSTNDSRWASTSDFCGSEGGMDEDNKASEKGKTESGNRSRSEHRDGHALVNGVYHQMLKPGVSAPRPRNKLRKTQKGMNDGKDGVGSRGPRLVIP